MPKLRALIVSLAVVATLGLGATAVVAVLPSVLGGGSGSSRIAAPVCPAADPVQVGAITVPRGPVAGYCQPELINAAHIMNAALDLGLGPHTQAVGVMTAMGESGLRNLDHGDRAGEDSRGLFQQRDNGAWGTLEDRMDPYTAATNFFNKLTTIDGWADLDPTDAAHRVQVNADPNHYARYFTDAQTVVAALTPQAPTTEATQPATSAQ